MKQSSTYLQRLKHNKFIQMKLQCAIRYVYSQLGRCVEELLLENEQSEAIDELIIKHEQHTYQKKVKRKNRKMNTQLLQHYDMACNGNGMN
jgi:hypothetical protein